MASHSFESDSGGEHASTNDDVASSQQWTTDFDDDDDDDDDDSETGDENRGGGGGDETKTDSGDDDESDDGYEKVVHHHHKSSVLSNSENCRSKKPMRRMNHLDNGPEKPQVQSDTETRNLLDDIGDFDDDCLDLQEAETSFNVDQQNYVIDPVMFELSEEQNDYYVKCFLYMLEKTQGCASVNGALNGSDIRVIEFFRKSQLDNSVLSRIWALADVNEDGFLNLSEFIVAMHLIILYLKGNVPIPVHLPAHVRPPATPTRHLIRMANGCFSTSLHSTTSVITAATVTEDVYSTTTTSASSNSTTNVGGADNTSRGSTNSQQRQHHQQHHYYDLVSSRYSNSATNTGRLRQLPLESAGGHCYSDSIQAGIFGGMDSADASVSSALRYGTVGGEPFDPNSTGVKQHSLSDDHLHMHAQREIGIAKFSDVPPVLVDSHPTALNAATSLGVGLAGGLLNGFSTSASRGPPPEPPTRDYNAAGGNSGKGHGRSASLDLKTFAALSSYPPKSPHLNSRLSRNESLIQQQQQPSGCLATLNEDLSQVVLSTAEENNITTIRREQSTQTDPLADSTTVVTAQLLTDYDEIFSSTGSNDGVIYSMSSSGEERCRLLRRLNDQLENERVTLAQVRLQLQLRIEEAQQELYRQQQSTEAQKIITVDSSIAAKPHTQTQQQIQAIKPKPTAV